jgi:hypothetical protein
MAQAIDDLTEKIYKKFLEKLRGDEEIPASLIDEIEKSMSSSELTSSEAISRAYENWEGNHAEN